MAKGKEPEFRTSLHVKLIREHAKNLGISPSRLLIVAGYHPASWSHYQRGQDIRMGTLNKILDVTAKDVAASLRRRPRGEE